MLEAHRLTKHYKDRAKGGRFCVLHEASLTLHEGEAVGLMGKSGSGKSTLVRLLLGLEIPDGGEVRWRGKDVFSLARNELRDFRRSVQFISQTPGTFFDPRYTLERSLREALQVQDVAPRAIWRECIAEQLARVGLSENLLRRYPHELSGGEMQRFSISRALLLKPSLLILDEPTSMLDISVQAQILHLLRDLREKQGIACLLVSHDAAVVQWFCQRSLYLENGVLHES